MNEPERLSRAADDDFERLLLRGGRVRAPRWARVRARVAASSALATATATTKGSAAKAAVLAKLASAATVKGIGVVSVVAVAALGTGAAIRQVARAGAHTSAGVVVTSRAKSATNASASFVAPTPEPDRNVGPPIASAIAPPAENEPLVEPPPPHRRVAGREPAHELAPDLASAPAPSPAPPRDTPPTGSSVPEEIRTLERARGRLEAGDPALALSILDAYKARFPDPVMAPEAATLRIEALLRAGDRPAALRAASAFLEKEPGTPYAARIQSLLGRPNP